MKRTDRIALVAVAVLILVAAGGVLAQTVVPSARDSSGHETDAEEADAPPTAEEIAHAAERLEASGIAVDDAVLDDLAARYGLGGAVRVLAWSDEASMGVEEIAAMRDGSDAEPGMGWGRIAHELGVRPGIGSIMGKGHDEDAPAKDKEPEPEE